MAHWHMQVFRNSRSRERYVYSKSQSECVRRRRSRCPSGRKSAKDRKLVRLLVYKRRLEDEILRKWSQKWGNSAQKNEAILLGGGGGRPTKQVSKIFDVDKFVAIVTERMEMDFKSKKEMWESIAQEYHGAIKVDKKKIDKLRFIWRHNDYNVQEKRLKIKSKFRQQTVSNESYMPGNLYQRATSDSSDTAHTENAVNKAERSGKNISINY